MRELDCETRALRRRLLVGLGGFAAAFVVLLALVTYAVFVYVRPEQGWLDAVMTLLGALPIVVLAAGLLAWAAMYLVELPSRLRGDYRCHRCGRPQRRLAALCPCVAAEFPTPKPRHWVHYRRRIKPVLLAYLAILGVVLIFLGTRTAPRSTPFVEDVIACHAVLCVLIGVMIRAADAILEFLKRGRRFRLRATVFLRVYALWPLLVAIGMLLAK